MPIAVHVAQARDLHALAELRAHGTGDAADARFEQRLAAWLVAEGDRRTTWLASLDARPAGMVSLLEYRRMPRPGRPDTAWGYLGNLFVRADARRRGIGSALVRAVLEQADRRGYARVVLSPSDDALTLYRRAGFVVPGDGAGDHRLLVRPGPDG